MAYEDDYLSPVERLIALAGTERVSGYTRKTKTGKTVRVSSYTRDPGEMSNMELFKEFKSLGSAGDSQAKNRKQRVLNEIRERQNKGQWGHSDAGAATRAGNRVDRSKGAEQRGRKESRAQFEENRANPKKTASRVHMYDTGEKDDKGNPVQKPALDESGKEVETPEYKEHIAKMTKIVDDIFADPKKLKKYDTQQKNGLFDADGNFVAYTPERTEQHKKILSDILAEHQNVPKDKQAIMSGGLGGAGKGTVLGGHPNIDKNSYLTIDPDEMKEELIRRGMGPDVPGLLPMEQATFIHEESSDLANMLQQIALSQGMNIILDTTMAAKKGTDDQSSADGKIQKFIDAGYEVDGIFVDVPVEVSVQSALGRHWGGVSRFNEGNERGELGGRYVPPAYIESARAPKGSPYNSKNRAVFERLKKEGKFRNAELWDTSDRSRPPQMVERGSVGKSSEKKADKTSSRAIENLKKKAAGGKEQVALSSVDRLRYLTSVRQ